MTSRQKPTPPETPNAKKSARPYDALPEEWRDQFEERAAIYEYEAKMPRDVAENLALLWVMKEMNGVKK